MSLLKFYQFRENCIHDILIFHPITDFHFLFSTNYVLTASICLKKIVYWPVRSLVEVLSHVGHSTAHGDTLAQAAGTYIDEIQPRSWMALQIGVDFTQLLQFRDWKETCFSPCSVEDWSSMALWEHKTIWASISGGLQVVLHCVEEQHRHDLGNRSTWCWVAGKNSIKLFWIQKFAIKTMRLI